MFDKAHEYQFHGQPLVALSPDHWLSPDPWLSADHGHMTDSSGVSVLGNISGTSGHGSGSTPSPSSLASSSSASNQTLVGSSGGLRIDLLWDSSVAHAPSSFKPAVTQAAANLASLFPTTNEEIYLHVGWGEVAGSRLAANALGESVSNGYLTDYATVTGALQHHEQLPSANNEPTTSQFFVTSAEAKALGLVPSTSTSVDGYIGFGTLSHTGDSWNFNTSKTPIAANQFDLQAVVQHEASEVMGRVGMEGQVISGQPTYTPLDLFNFSSTANSLELSANGGYLSTDGTTHLGNYNTASASGGDIADWASQYPAQSGTLPSTAPANAYDSFNAFATPGYVGQLTSSDILEMQALGYGSPNTA
jgi:hypothetical protein